MAKSTVYVKESTGARVIEQGRARLLCVGLFFVLSFGSIGGRLVNMMIQSYLSAPKEVAAPARENGDDAESEVHATSSNLSRGNVVDRNGMLLATSLMTESAFANPREMSNVTIAADKLSRTLGLPKEVLLKRLKGNRSFVWIKRHLTPSEQQAVNNLGIPGVYFVPEEKRVYPYGNCLSHVLGYVGVDNHGLSGIEKTFDKRLSDSSAIREPLALSIDIRVQHILRDEMNKAVAEFKAIGATGVVLDAHTGEIIAMSSLPDFDPHHPANATDAQKFNRAALGVYEMGSTFKSFTMAMALDSGRISMKDGYDATNPLKISTFTINDAHGKKRWLSVPEIYAYSSNIGTAKMALDMGTKAQKSFLEKMGMLSPLQVELPERAAPQFPGDWKEINTVTISYGHGISVSPLHLVRGIATLVNGGVLPTLTLVKADDSREVSEDRVIKERTSVLMRKMLRLVVKHGTGGKADINGYRVGGKTGTAEKINLGGKYNVNAKLSSFIAAFPVDDPKYVVLVMVDEPVGNKSTYGYSTGGWVAAPAVGRIISRMSPMLGLKPEYDSPADDAEKYWVDTEKKTTQTARAEKPVDDHLIDRRFIHAVSY